MAKANRPTQVEVSPFAGQVLSVGIDAASSGAKVAYEAPNGEIRTIFVDSILATTNEQKLGQFGRALIRKFTSYQPINGSSPDVIKHRGVANVVGDGAERFIEPYQPLSPSRLLDGQDLIKLILTALSKIPLAQGQEISAELSLPVGFTRTTDPDVLRESISQWFLGQHRFEVNGQSYQINIVDFNYAEQPIHAVIGMARNRQGEWIDSMPEESAISLVDLGGYSADTTWIKQFAINYNLTKGAALGFYLFAEQLGTTLMEQYGVPFTSFEAAKILRAYAEGQEATIEVGDYSYPVDNEAKQVFDRMATQLINFCRVSLPEAQAKKSVMVLVGGPAALPSLVRKFKQEYPKIRVVPDRFLSAKGALFTNLWAREATE